MWSEQVLERAVSVCTTRGDYCTLCVYLAAPTSVSRCATCAERPRARPSSDHEVCAQHWEYAAGAIGTLFAKAH